MGCTSSSYNPETALTIAIVPLPTGRDLGSAMFHDARHALLWVAVTGTFPESPDQRFPAAVASAMTDPTPGNPCSTRREASWWVT